MIAAVQSNRVATHVMSVAKFERFFQIAAGLNVDKQDLKRYSDFINQKRPRLWRRYRGSVARSGGGLSVALARAFKIIDGDVKNP